VVTQRSRTLRVVVVANHWYLDAVVAAGLLAHALLAVRDPGRHRLRALADTVEREPEPVS
jgi:hypothetical protein